MIWRTRGTAVSKNAFGGGATFAFFFAAIARRYRAARSTGNDVRYGGGGPCGNVAYATAASASTTTIGTSHAFAGSGAVFVSVGSRRSGGRSAHDPIAIAANTAGPAHFAGPWPTNRCDAAAPV